MTAVVPIFVPSAITARSQAAITPAPVPSIKFRRDILIPDTSSGSLMGVSGTAEKVLKPVLASGRRVGESTI